MKNKTVKVSSMRKVTQGKGDRQNREGRRPLLDRGSEGSLRRGHLSKGLSHGKEEAL